MPPRRPLGPWTWFFILLAALAALVAWFAVDGPGPARLNDDGPRLVYLVLLAALIGSGLIHGRRLRWQGALGAAFVWIAIGAALVLAWSFRFEAADAWRRIKGELLPGQVMVAGARAIEVRRAGDGHFYIDARVNGVPLRFLVDTGASTTVLDPADAMRVGFNLERLSFYERLRTANGTVRAAPVTAARLDFGPFAIVDARLLVNGAPIGTSLLGINTLSRFKGWRVEREKLILEY